MTTPEPNSVSSHLASQLLRQSAARPVDELLRRLEQPDCAAWVERALATSPLDSLRAAWPVAPLKNSTASGRLSLDAFKRVKEQAKALVQEPQREEDRPRGLLAYYLSIAGALRQHKTLITGQKRAQVNEAIADIASLMPEPWPDWLGAAAMHGGDAPTR